MAEAPPKKRRIALSLEMDWGFKRHQETFAGCYAYGMEADWECLIHPAPDRAFKMATTEFVGIIARATPEMVAVAKQAQIPIVYVWVYSPAEDVPSVLPDSEATGRAAAEHLLGRGFRNFGYLGHTRDVSSRSQWEGFSSAITEAGYPSSRLRFSRVGVEGVAPGWERFVHSVNRWIDSWTPPVGIFVNQDLYCRYLIDICRARGLHVSQDVAIVGAGNEDIICDSPTPSLTSIDFGHSRIGYEAAALLDKLMSGEKAPTEPVFVPPAELVPRQSTDVFATNDPLVTRALRFIAEHSHDRITVREVVEAVATNRRSLERRFRDSLGQSIAGEITRLRLERAKRRIVETDAPMKDIALDAGFRNADHFYKVFSRVEGMTPSRFREERQNVFVE